MRAQSLLRGNQLPCDKASSSDIYTPGGPLLDEKPTFSSLFSSALNLNETTSVNTQKSSEMLPLHSFSESLMDGDGVYLQISNLDQYFDEANLKQYLTNQLKPITPILSLSIETPSIAKIRVPSVQVSTRFLQNLTCHSSKKYFIFSNSTLNK